MARSLMDDGGGSNGAEGHTWFETVTGHSQASAQAWRDNFNGGLAAGDWTGNHNAISPIFQGDGRSGSERERDAGITAIFQGDGATGNRLLAEARARNAARQAANAGRGQGGPTAIAPNQPGGAPPPPSGGTWSPLTGPGKGSGGAGSTDPKKQKWGKVELSTGYEDKATQVIIGGALPTVDRGWSDAGEFEQRYGEMLADWYGVGVLYADQRKQAIDDLAQKYGSDLMRNDDGAWGDFQRWDAEHGAKAGSDINRWIAEHNPFAPRTNTGELVMGGF